MACSHSTSCELYPLLAMEPALKLWKQHYCEGGYEKCARYRLALNGKAVPLTLLPNGKQLAPRSKKEINAAALFNAIQKGRLPLIRSMFKTGVAQTEATTSDGTTPLMAAASVGNAEIINLLLQHNANPFRKNRVGETALSIATRFEHHECVAVLKRKLATSEPADYTEVKVDDEEEARSSIVGFLKKLNPFKSHADAES